MLESTIGATGQTIDLLNLTSAAFSMPLALTTLFSAWLLRKNFKFIAVLFFVTILVTTFVGFILARFLIETGLFAVRAVPGNAEYLPILFFVCLATVSFGYLCLMGTCFTFPKARPHALLVSKIGFIIAVVHAITTPLLQVLLLS